MYKKTIVIGSGPSELQLVRYTKKIIKGHNDRCWLHKKR